MTITTGRNGYNLMAITGPNDGDDDLNGSDMERMVQYAKNRDFLYDSLHNHYDDNHNTTTTNHDNYNNNQRNHRNQHHRHPSLPNSNHTSSSRSSTYLVE